MPVVPQSAVLQDRDGRFVYLVAKGNKVSQRRIDTGARVGNGWAVTSGLGGGEQVVVQGIQRLASFVQLQLFYVHYQVVNTAFVPGAQLG